MDPSPPPGQPGEEGPPGYQLPPYQPAEYGAPQYGAPQYGAPQYGPPPFQPQYGPPQYGYPAYGPPPPPLKPGCVPLRPLALSDILDGSFQVIRRNPKATLGLSAVVAVIQAAGQALFQLVLYRSDSAPSGFSSSNDLTTSGGTPVGQISAIFSVLVLSTLLGAILTGMLTAVVTEDVLGVRLAIGRAWDRAKRRFWSLVGLAVVTTVAEVLGLIPCLVLGVWLWGIWAVAVPTMMVEGTTIRGSLRRSRQLTEGMFWRVWGIRALGVLLTTVISGLIAAPFQIIGLLIDGFDIEPGTVPVALILFAALGSILSITATAPIRAGIDALLYVDLRMRKEGLDLVLQQRAAAPVPAQPVPPAPRW